MPIAYTEEQLMLRRYKAKRVAERRAQEAAGLVEIECLDNLLERNLYGDRLSSYRHDLDKVNATTKAAALNTQAALENRRVVIAPPVVSGDGKITYIVIGPPVAGIEINTLLFLAAPSKKYDTKFDRRDTINDWTDLFDDTDQVQVKRRKAHQNIPGWLAFEACRLRLLESIEKEKSYGQLDADTLYPVLAWSVDAEGVAIWEPEYGRTVVERYKTDETEGQRYLDELGKLVLASFSPEITTRWDTRGKYTPASQRDQDMGPTQVLPLVLGRAASFLNGYVLRQIEGSLNREYSLSPNRTELPTPDYYSPSQGL